MLVSGECVGQLAGRGRASHLFELTAVGGPKEGGLQGAGPSQAQLQASVRHTRAAGKESGAGGDLAEARQSRPVFMPCHR